MDEVTELIEKAKSEFRCNFHYELTDEDITKNDDNSIDINYDDFDLSLLEAYKSSMMIESAEIMYDGRARYIKVYAHLSPGDL